MKPTDLCGGRILAAARVAAAATPAGRDRVVDLLRGASLAVVVVGHTLMSLVTWEAGVPRLGNLLGEVKVLQLLTYVLQVMPAFFAAGAIANARSWRAASGAGTPWREWMWGRTRRLMRPVLYYLALWVPLSLALGVLVPAASGPLASLSVQLLWFLGVYVPVVALTPLQQRLAAHGWWSVAGLVALVAVVDLVRFGAGVEAVGVMNFLVVWLMAAVCGLVVRAHAGRRWLWAVAAACVGANAVLVAVGPYPVSMVGMPGDEVSNMAPPTLALALHAVALVCAVGALWGALERLCERAGVWVATCAVGGVAMTAYLWHLTALVGVVLVSHELGLDRPSVSSPWFWPATVAYLVAVGAAVVVLVSLAAPLEYLPVPWLERHREGTGRWRQGAEVVSVVVLGVGLLSLAAVGMGGFPTRVVDYAGIPLSGGLAFALIAAGLAAGRAGGASVPRADAPRR